MGRNVAKDYTSLQHFATTAANETATTNPKAIVCCSMHFGTSSQANHFQSAIPTPSNVFSTDKLSLRNIMVSRASALDVKEK
jgi:hypothetical protein